MRFRSGCAVFALLLALFARLAAASTISPQIEVRGVLDAQVEAWNRGDIDGYMNGYARGDATLFVSGDTVTRGWQTVRDRYATRYDSRDKMGTLAFSDVEITMLGDTVAAATGRWELTRAGDKPHGRFTVILRRTPEGWRIVHDHTSSAD